MMESLRMMRIGSKLDDGLPLEFEDRSSEFGSFLVDLEVMIQI